MEVVIGDALYECHYAYQVFGNPYGATSVILSTREQASEYRDWLANKLPDNTWYIKQALVIEGEKIGE